MLRKLSKRTVETLEFRGVLVVLALVAAAIIYVSLFAGHRPTADDEAGPPGVPAGDAPPPSRR